MRDPEDLSRNEIFDIIEKFARGTPMVDVAKVHEVDVLVVKEIVNGRMFQEVAQITTRLNSDFRTMADVDKKEEYEIKLAANMGVSILDISVLHHLTYDTVVMILNPQRGSNEANKSTDEEAS